MNNLFSKSLLSLCLATSLLTACQKDENGNPEPPKTYLVKSLNDGTVTYKYEYDDKGRLTKEERPQDGTLRFTYTDTNVIEKRYDLSNTLEETREYKLDGNGLAKLCKEEHRIVYYTYNSQKQLLTANADNYDINGSGNVTSVSEMKYYYTNNNLDSITITNHIGGSSYSYPAEKYESYYTDKVNVLNSANFGEAWRGNNSRNLVKTGLSWSTPTSPMKPFTFTYDFDNLGRVVKVTSSDPQIDPGATEITYY